MSEITVSYLAGKLETEKRKRQAIIRDLRAEIVEIEEEKNQVKVNTYSQSVDKELDRLDESISRAERRIGMLS